MAFKSGAVARVCNIGPTDAANCAPWICCTRFSGDPTIFTRRLAVMGNSTGKALIRMVGILFRLKGGTGS